MADVDTRDVQLHITGQHHPPKDHTLACEAAGKVITTLNLDRRPKIMNGKATLPELIVQDLFPAIKMLTEWGYEMLFDLDEIDAAVDAGGDENYVVKRLSPQRTVLLLRTVADLY